MSERVWGVVIFLLVFGLAIGAYIIISPVTGLAVMGADAFILSYLVQKPIANIVTVIGFLLFGVALLVVIF